jgi:CRISPR-associated protein Cmr2
MTRRVLHFSLGPVQGFIGSARRTRDLWAGSFLLSWLTGHAMAAVHESKGTITMPSVYGPAGRSAIVDETLDAIFAARAAVGSPPPTRWRSPLTGTLPNHFRAELPEGFDPTECRTAALKAWRRLATAVFDTFVRPVAGRLEAKNVEAIWKEQIPDSGDNDPFWDMVWVAGDNPNWEDEARWLERRKAWRNHLPPGENVGRDRCFMMPDFAELSGFARSSGRIEREAQDAFWEALRLRIREVMYPRAKPHEIGQDVWLKTLELRENERLCAIALVKRLFPVLPAPDLADAIGWIPAASDFPTSASDEGAALALRNWPSTAFMSAVHWIEEAWHKDRSACESYAKDQRNALHHAQAMAERPTHHKIKCLRDLTVTKREATQVAAPFAYLDGGLFFPRTLEANRYAESKDTTTRAAKAKELSDRYDQLREQLGKGTKIAPPSPFYALLAMDGDSLGQWVSKEPLAPRISAGLRAFGAAALTLIRDHNGVAIYAGADDVLALFPIEDAIPAAITLNGAYRQKLTDETRVVPAGAGFDAGKHATISAGLVFADFQVPLSDVRDEARRLLDRVAKEANERDSIAISVFKSGGISAEWVSAWDADLAVFRTGMSVLTEPGLPPQRLYDLAKAQGELGQKAPLASRFPYLIQSRLGDLFAAGSSALGGSDAVALLRAEFAGSRREASTDLDEDKLMSELFHVSQSHRSRRRGKATPPTLSLDGLMIVRFLADAGQWRNAP